ncbi:hypothetical protein BDQ12DRAFT_613596, partial [Crucibulum laeve]
ADSSTSTILYMDYNYDTKDRFFTPYYDVFFYYFRHGGYASFEFSAKVWTTQQQGTVAFWELLKPGSPRFYTGSVEEKDNAINNLGYPGATVVAWIYGSPDPICSSVPFFHLFNNVTGDHYYTTSTTNRDSYINSGGYIYIGITGYVLPYTP